MANKLKAQQGHTAAAENSLGYDKALELLYTCSTTDGFLATPTESTNYRRIWARDGVIIGLAALLSGDHDLIESYKYTLETLAKHQGPHGEIPSNVDPVSERISYGGTTGRVDADLWFIIGCGEYWLATGDDGFLERLLPTLEKVRALLGAWEFNNRGLIYVPQTGDWADEYLHSGYVLYDQLLYLQAQRTLCALHAHVHGTTDHVLLERINRLRHLIRDNYWFDHQGNTPEDIYHEVLYNKGHDAASHRCGSCYYWMPFFSPTGYGYRFDAFANVLASLFDIADETQRQHVDQFITQIAPEELPLLPAFYPVIQPVDEDWRHLQMTFSFTFKNKPHEFQNGGLWPMITGFYVADLAKRGQQTRAQMHLDAIYKANAMPMEDETWSFPEFVHGQHLTAGGTLHQGWSAAAAIIAQHTLNGDKLFRIDHHE